MTVSGKGNSFLGYTSIMYFDEKKITMTTLIQFWMIEIIIPVEIYTQVPQKKLKSIWNYFPII